jgi:type 1 glutamine amidotransferase
MLKTSIALLLLFTFYSGAAKKEKKVLLFTKTAGFHHASIPAGIAAIQKLGAANGYAVDTTTNSALFTYKNLKQYAAIIFLNTTGNVFDSAQQEGLVKYIHKGGGFAGVHAASDTEMDWPWYVRLVGASFSNHPKPQVANILVVDSMHPATRHLPRPWKKMEEWYNFKAAPADVHVLLAADESTYEGGKNGTNHPLAWYQNFEGGRSFYTALGHFDDAYSDTLFLKHLSEGIQFAMGQKQKSN